MLYSILKFFNNTNSLYKRTERNICIVRYEKSRKSMYIAIHLNVLDFVDYLKHLYFILL